MADKNHSLEKEQARDELIYQIVNDRHNLEWNRTDHLDTKIYGVIASAGFLTTVAGGIIGILPNDQYKWVLVLPLVLFGISAIIGLIAYSVRSFEEIDPEKVIQSYKNQSQTILLREVASTIAWNTNKNIVTNKKKAKLLQASAILLVMASFAFIFVIVLLWSLGLS
jgi:hypothetical protein